MADHEILRITADDIDAEGNYVGAADVTDWGGSIEIAADLGCVRFRDVLRAKFSIRALAGTGIEAGWGIEAGEGIEAGWGIKAGEGIEAGLGIEAGEGIEAGWGIKACLGIEAGFSISAKWVSSRIRIFAGTCIWRQPEPEEMQVRAELRGGTIAFGGHVPPKPVTEATS